MLEYSDDNGFILMLFVNDDCRATILDCCNLYWIWNYYFLQCLMKWLKVVMNLVYIYISECPMGEMDIIFIFIVLFFVFIDYQHFLSFCLSSPWSSDISRGHSEHLTGKGGRESIDCKKLFIVYFVFQFDSLCNCIEMIN